MAPPSDEPEEEADDADAGPSYRLDLRAEQEEDVLTVRLALGREGEDRPLGTLEATLRLGELDRTPGEGDLEATFWRAVLRAARALGAEEAPPEEG